MKAKEFLISKIQDCNNNITIFNTKKYLEVQDAEQYANKRVIEEIDEALHLIEKGELNNVESYLLGRLMVAGKETNS